MRGVSKGLVMGGALVATLLAVPAVLQPAAADEIGRDRRELRQDYRELRDDQRDLQELQRREQWQLHRGDYNGAAYTRQLQNQKEREIARDRAEIQRDRYELRRDTYDSRSGWYWNGHEWRASRD